MKKEEAEVVMRSIETLRSVRSFKPDSIPKETLDRILRAAHAFCMGTCITIHGSTPTRAEHEVKKILGIPENIKIACLVYMGYPSHRYGRPRRRPIEDHVRYEKWDLVG